MIARIWHGVARAENSDEMLEYFRATGLEGFRATEGHRGALMLRRTQGDRSEFLLISLWDSLDAIKRFAGEEYEKAVYYPEDARLLVNLEPTVAHYEVAERTI